MPLLKEREVAKLLMRTVDQLRDDRTTGKGVPFVRVGVRGIRYRSEDVALVVEQKRAGEMEKLFKKGVAAERDRVLEVVRAELNIIKELILQNKPVAEIDSPLKTMQVRTAASLYDVKEHYLRVLCTRGTVKAHMVGGRWFITKEEMARVFLGVNTPLSKCQPKPEEVKGKATLKMIAEEYDVGIDLLRAMCNDQRLKAQKLGISWYVPRGEAERVFGVKKIG